MHLKPLLNKPVPPVPEDIRQQLGMQGLTLTAFENKNLILQSTGLRSEVGYRSFPNGNYLVSMTCPMPGITPDMIRWWFWWHPQENIRYQLWFPGEHYANAYAKKDAAYFRQKTLPMFQPNTQYPTERIAGVRMPLRIDFVHPRDFGFSESAMQENAIPLIVCGHVSAFGGLIPHTEMAHIFSQTEDGLQLSSRFWIGQTLKGPLLRKLILTDRTAREMAGHCCVEYRRLAEILPGLYDDWLAKQHSSHLV